MEDKSRVMRLPKLTIPEKVTFKSHKGIVHLTDEEIDKKTEEIFNFLSKIHTELSDLRFRETGTKDIAIHLRAIFRDTEEEKELIKSKGKKVYTCYYQNIFRFNGTGKKNLKNFLRCLNNTGRAYCLYYGVYSFDDAIPATEKIEQRRLENKRHVKNSFTSKNANGTKVLVADFDHITYEEFIEIKKTFPFETIDVFSGHGFQCIVLLNQYSRDLTLLEKFVFTMWEKGFNVDLVARDVARIMRMPYMFNAKEHITKIDGLIWETFVLNDTDIRYSVEDVFDLLEKMPTVRTISDDLKNKSSKNNKVENNKVEIIEQEFIEEVYIEKKDDVDIDFLIQNYPQIDILKLEKPIQLLLQGFRKGYAEHTVMFLTNYFSEYGYSLNEIQNILLRLAELNTYHYAWQESIVLEKIETFYNYAYKNYSTCNVYNDNLKEEYGNLNLKEEFEFIRKNKIKINNKFFKELRIPDSSSKKLKSSITPTAMFVYFALLIDSFRFDRDTYSRNDIIEITKLSDKTVRSALKSLVKHGYILKYNNHVARTGKPKDYKLALDVHNSVKINYTLMDVSDIDNLIGKVMLGIINAREFQLCLYFLYKINKNIEALTLSQQQIANDLLISRSQLVAILTSLDEKGLINREKIEMGYCNRYVYRYSVKF